MSNYNIKVTNKFKTNYLLTRYIVEANQANTALASLLSGYLTYANNTHQTFKEASDNLDSLYGTKFDILFSIKGKQLVIDFVASFISTKYIKATDYLSDVMNSYLDYIFNPLVIDDNFSLEVFDLKKFELIEKIKQTYDDKTAYAVEQYYKAFGPDTPLELNINGSESEVNKITARKLYDFYLEMIKQTPIIEAQVTEADYDLIKDKLKTKITEIAYDNRFETYQLVNEQVEELIENQDIVQSKLLIGYASVDEFKKEDFYKLLLAGILLGGSSSSFLFRIVREQENLCYTIRSMYDQYSNTITIFAGIDKSNYDKTISLITKIISDLQAGQITEQELEDSKLILIDIINKTKDSQASMVAYYLNRMMQKLNDDFDLDIEAINELTVNDLVSVFKQFKLKTKYLLAGDNNE